MSEEEVYYLVCYAEIRAAGSVRPKAGGCSTGQKIGSLPKEVTTKAGHYASGLGQRRSVSSWVLHPAFVGCLPAHIDSELPKVLIKVLFWALFWGKELLWALFLVLSKVPELFWALFKALYFALYWNTFLEHFFKH